MTTPVTREQTIAVLDDAIAFTKAADACGLSESVARRFAAALGALPAAQVARICASARAHQLAAQARIRHHNATTRRGR